MADEDVSKYFTGLAPAKKTTPAGGGVESYFQGLTPGPAATTTPEIKTIEPGQQFSPEESQSIFGKEPGVDYSKGAPIDVRYNLFRARAGPEEEAYLSGVYGASNIKKDRGGNWLVKEPRSQDWMPVYPEGVMEGIKTLGAGIAQAAPTTLAAAGGAAVGAPAGPVGMTLGAMTGAGIARGGDEAIKALQGFQRGTPWENLGSIYGEAALAGLSQGMGPAAKQVAPEMYRTGAKIIGKFGGATPETTAIAHSLERFGVTPPIQSLAPGFKAFEYDRYLRNTIAKDPKEGARLLAVDARMKEVLNKFGLQGPELEHAFQTITRQDMAVSGRDTGEAVVGALQRRDRELAGEELALREQVHSQIQGAYDNLRNVTRNVDPRLGAQVTGAFEEARAQFNQDMGVAYSNISRMTGNAPLVDMHEVSMQARRLVEGMDPMQVPPVIRRLITPEDGSGVLTFDQAHNTRTALRELARYKDLSPIGQRRGEIRLMAGMVDEAITNAAGQVGQDAARLLREADTAYAQGITRFTSDTVNQMVYDVRQGRMPNPEKVADMLLDKNSLQATEQLWDMLPPQVQNQVRLADMKNLIDGASVRDQAGRHTLTGQSLLEALDERETINNLLYSPVEIRNLRTLAEDFMAYNGKLDVTQLPATALRSTLEQAIGVRRAMEEEFTANPSLTRRALRSPNPETVDAAANYFMAPGKEAVTEAGARLMGVNSPEWQQVQRHAIMTLLQDAVVPKGLGRTVAGGEIQQMLGKYTQRQQLLLFGANLPDIALLAQQAKALFPELEKSYGASIAGANIMGGLPAIKSIRKYTWSRVAGAVADSPQLARAIVGQLQADPYKGRAFWSWMLQGGLDMAMNRMQKTEIFQPGSDFSGMFGAQPRGPGIEPTMPAQQSESEPRSAVGYGD